MICRGPGFHAGATDVRDGPLVVSHCHFVRGPLAATEGARRPVQHVGMRVHSSTPQREVLTIDQAQR